MVPDLGKNKGNWTSTKWQQATFYGQLEFSKDVTKTAEE